VKQEEGKICIPPVVVPRKGLFTTPKRLNLLSRIVLWRRFGVIS
jgi:hypothetical protein